MSSAYELRGEQMLGQELADVQPVPRLYLIEHENSDGTHELRAMSRFAYNGLNCIAAKNAPPISYARDVENDKVVKVHRQTEFENSWWRRFSTDEFGMKCGNVRDGTTQDVFLLRKKVHPFDFLKNMVPKLAEAGVEIFGEAELTLAKINRARPTIQFNVTSGIDWFDVQAVINFGDLQVS